MWRAWQETGAISDRIRIAISAGAPLPVDLEREIHEQTGVKVHNFYGSTECGGIAYDRSDLPRESAGLVGSPMDETELSVNAESCLEVRGPSVASAYWPKDEADATQLGGGCFVTSDLAKIEKSGERRDRLGFPVR